MDAGHGLTLAPAVAAQGDVPGGGDLDRGSAGPESDLGGRGGAGAAGEKEEEKDYTPHRPIIR